jgi:hypothetical protein
MRMPRTGHDRPDDRAERSRLAVPEIAERAQRLNSLGEPNFRTAAYMADEPSGFHIKHSTRKPLVETTCIALERSSTSSTHNQYIEVCLSGESSGALPTFGYRRWRGGYGSLSCRSHTDSREYQVSRSANACSRPTSAIQAKFSAGRCCLSLGRSENANGIALVGRSVLRKGQDLVQQFEEKRRHPIANSGFTSPRRGKPIISRASAGVAGS